MSLVRESHNAANREVIKPVCDTTVVTVYVLRDAKVMFDVCFSNGSRLQNPFLINNGRK